MRLRILSANRHEQGECVHLSMRKMLTHRREYWTLLGFVLLFLGFLSLVLSMLGVQFQFMTWMDGLGKGLAFVIRVLMILAGFMLVISSQTKEEEDTPPLR